MKSVCNLFIMAVFALSLGLSGCAKEDPAKPLDIGSFKTATVEGTILYITDVTTGTTQKYSSPPTLEINASIPYSALKSGATGTYYIPKKDITYSGGKYTVTVPVGPSGANVTIIVSPFLGTQKQTKSGSNIDVNGLWRLSGGNSFTVNSVLPGQTALETVKKLYFTEQDGVGSDV